MGMRYAWFLWFLSLVSRNTYAELDRRSGQVHAREKLNTITGIPTLWVYLTPPANLAGKFHKFASTALDMGKKSSARQRAGTVAFLRKENIDI